MHQRLRQVGALHPCAAAGVGPRPFASPSPGSSGTSPRGRRVPMPSLSTPAPSPQAPKFVSVARERRCWPSCRLAAPGCGPRLRLAGARPACVRERGPSLLRVQRAGPRLPGPGSIVPAPQARRNRRAPVRTHARRALATGVRTAKASGEGLRGNWAGAGPGDGMHPPDQRSGRAILLLLAPPLLSTAFTSSPSEPAVPPFLSVIVAVHVVAPDFVIETVQAPRPG